MIRIGRLALTAPQSVAFNPRDADTPSIAGPFRELGYNIRGRESGSGAQALMSQLEREAKRWGAVHVIDDNAAVPAGYYTMEPAPSYEKPSGSPTYRPWSISLVRKDAPVIARQAEDDRLLGSAVADVTAEEALRVAYTAAATEAAVLRGGTDLLLAMKLDETEGNVGANLIINGDFTTYTLSPGIPDNWIAIGPGAGVTVARETATFFDAPNACRVTCDWTLASLGATHGAAQTIAGLVSGKSYFFRARVHLLDPLEAGSTLVCKLRNQTDGVDLSSSSTPAGVTVGQWVVVSGSFHVDDAADAYRVEFGLYKNPGSGSAGSDSFSIDKIEVQEIRAADFSGLGNHGILEGGANTLGPTVGVAGKVGTAYDLDGVGDRIRIPDSASLRASSFTIAIGVNPDTIRVQGIFGKGIVDAAHWACRIFMQSTGIIEVDSSAAGSTEVGNLTSSPTALAAGTWSLLVVSFDKAAQLLTLDINGVQVKSATVADMFWDMPALAGTDLQIGWNATNRLDGKVDEPRIWRRALTAEERRAYYTAWNSGVRPLSELGPTGEHLNLPAGDWKLIARVQSRTTVTQRFRATLRDKDGNAIVTGAQVTVGAGNADAWVDVDLGTFTVPAANDGLNFYEISVQANGDLNDVWLDRVKVVPA